MSRELDLTFPTDLPRPQDDGACNHLIGATIAQIDLPLASKPSEPLPLSSLKGLYILFCYPRSGAPGEKIPPEWDAIPGARGCTPQACSYRERLSDLKRLGVSDVFGLSTQSPEYQRELKERVHLPYELLSDADLKFQTAMGLPTFMWQDTVLIKRLTLAIEDGVVRKVWYPVFPPDQNVNDVMEWLKSRSSA